MQGGLPLRDSKIYTPGEEGRRTVVRGAEEGRKSTPI